MTQPPVDPFQEFPAVAFEAVFRRSGTIMLLVDGETWTIVHANQAAERFYGLPREHLRTRTLDAINGVTREAWEEERRRPGFSEALPTIRSHQAAGGQVRTVRESYTPVQMGERAGLLLEVDDAAPRETLRPSEEEFAQAFKMSPDAISITRLADGAFLEVNDGFTVMTGYAREEAVGRSSRGDDLGLWVRQEDRDRLVAGIQAQETVTDLEVRFRRKDGRVLTGSVAARPIRVGGEPCLLLIVRDITAARQAREALLLSEEKFAQAFKMSPDCISISRLADGTYLEVNEGFTATMGYTREEAIGRSARTDDLGIWVHPEDRERLVADIQTQGAVTDIEAQFRRKDGRLILGSLSARPIRVGGESCLLIIVRDITAARQAQEALRLSEEKLALAFNTSPDAITISRLNDGTFLEVNDGFLAVQGYTREEVIGRSARADDLGLWVHPEDRDRLQAGIRAHGTVSGLEAQFRRRDGRIIIGSIFARVIRVRGEPCLLVVNRDVTEQRRTEDDLRTSHGYLRALIDSFPFLVWLKDEQSRFLAVNRPFAEACGSGLPERVVGKTDLDVWPREIAEAYRADDRGVLESGLPKNVEEPIALSGKEIAWFETYKSPVQVNDRIVGTVGFSRDISERKRNEELLAAERERLLVTLRSIGDGVIATDTRGRVVIMNAVAETMTGWTQAEAQDRPLEEVFTIVHEITRQPCDNPVGQVLASAATVELASHTVLIARNGTERIIGDSGAPILDRKGRSLGVVLVFRDMTEKQRLLEAAQRTQKLEALSVLAGGIAHDFNNLLGGLFGHLDLAREANRDPEVADLLQTALNSLERSRSLTQQLLTFAKGGTPVQKVEWVGPLLNETARFVLSGSNVSYEIDVAPDLRPARFDRNQLGQALDNILLNAQQAMPNGGVIQIRAANLTLAERSHPYLPAGEYVRISVSDRGIGIPKEILPRIFDPFFTTKRKGSGLGLATSYSILKQHDGAIDVESKPGKGSTFHLLLPASRSGVDEKPDLPPSLSPRRTGRILVMDDEPLIQDLMRNVLGRLGFSATVTGNGHEAVAEFFRAQAEGTSYLAVILDLTVPGGMGGQEAAQLIRQRDLAVPLFVASGYAEDPVVAEPGQYGFTGSLRKPFLIAELQQLLANV
jgi:PAS domain S-box-containing protein